MYIKETTSVHLMYYVSEIYGATPFMLVVSRTLSLSRFYRLSVVAFWSRACAYGGGLLRQCTNAGNLKGRRRQPSTLMAHRPMPWRLSEIRGPGHQVMSGRFKPSRARAY